ncbi:hypothetical protein PCE1_002384 [Barthelona sp. PCE]
MANRYDISPHLTTIFENINNAFEVIQDPKRSVHSVNSFIDHLKTLRQALERNEDYLTCQLIDQTISSLYEAVGNHKQTADWKFSACHDLFKVIERFPMHQHMHVHNALVSLLFDLLVYLHEKEAWVMLQRLACLSGNYFFRNRFYSTALDFFILAKKTHFSESMFLIQVEVMIAYAYVLTKEWELALDSLQYIESKNPIVLPLQMNSMVELKLSIVLLLIINKELSVAKEKLKQFKVVFPFVNTLFLTDLIHTCEENVVHISPVLVTPHEVALTRLLCSPLANEIATQLLLLEWL